jgi:hypothetical protein
MAQHFLGVGAGPLSFSSRSQTRLMQSQLVDFIEQSFGSVWDLEMMLVLHESQPRRWKGGELVAHLRSSEAIVLNAIDRLLACGLALKDPEGAVNYSPESDETRLLVDALCAEYRRTPAAVRRMIIQASRRDSSEGSIPASRT